MLLLNVPLQVVLPPSVLTTGLGARDFLRRDIKDGSKFTVLRPQVTMERAAVLESSPSIQRLGAGILGTLGTLVEAAGPAAEPGFVVSERGRLVAFGDDAQGESDITCLLCRQAKHSH